MKPCRSSDPSLEESGGGKGIRTPGLVIANDALYQLSYTPTFCRTSAVRRAKCVVENRRPSTLLSGIVLALEFVIVLVLVLVQTGPPVVEVVRGGLRKEDKRKPTSRTFEDEHDHAPPAYFLSSCTPSTITCPSVPAFETVTLTERPAGSRNVPSDVSFIAPAFF